MEVATGHIVALRLYDVAFAIDLAQAEALWSRHAAGRAARSRLTGTPPKAMAFGVAPLALALDPVELHLETGRVTASVAARLYDFGAVTLALRVPVAGLPWDAYVAQLNAVGRAAADWPALLAAVQAVLAPAMTRPIAKVLEEDFLIATVQTLSERLTAADLLARIDVVPLLSGESRPLSDGARADLVRQRFSYYPDDLVMLTWDRAFILEPRGDNDVADVLEVANAQLLEMRYYDELLDDELPRMYDLVETARRGLNVFTSRRYGTLARRLYTLVAEVTELTERVDNALQVTEDVYLARIYGAALELYRVPLVTAAVNRKLAIVRDTYQALYDEASSARSEVMEVAVILLILAEVVLALLRH
ncbi:MAG: hypothetical protein JOY70_03210 [Acidisphaera sp.]|nr:hypothetical protein [Acidisphaera sp.]MBV9812363.1 hypothetical protein [Acetobacteraceae bacterium]